jgi:hypothetical protein
MATRRNQPLTPPTPPAREAVLGPAERILTTLLTYHDHLYHGRSGIVVRDPSNPAGVTWKYAVWKLDAAGVKQASFVTKGPVGGKQRGGRGNASTRLIEQWAGMLGCEIIDFPKAP